MEYVRPHFDDAVEAFKDFLYSQQWSPNLLWLSKNRLIGHKRKYWIFRPEELTSDSNSRALYESAWNTKKSIRLDGFCQINGRSLVYVEDYGGDSGLLNYGISLADHQIMTVQSKIKWIFLVARHKNHKCFMDSVNMTLESRISSCTRTSQSRQKSLIRQ